MSETLVIRLRAAEEAPASWLVLDGNGARSGPMFSGPVSDALGLAEGRRVVLLLPGTEVTLAEPELPVRGGASRLVQVVPYALEEQLASDVDTLHFTVGPRAADSVGTPVAIVSRSLMQRWYGACEAAGIHLDAAYADSAAVPVAATGCTLLLDESLLYVRPAGGVPYVLDAAVLPEALELALPAPDPDAEGVEPGEHVTFYAGAAEYEQHRDAIEGLRDRTASLQVKLLPEGPLPVLAAQAVSGGGVNLLQGPFSSRASLGSRLRAWRLPAALAAGTALLFAVNQGLGWWQGSRIEKNLDAQIAQVFAQVLPGQPVVDPRAQIQGALGAQDNSGAGLLPAMTALADAMAQAPSAKIEAMSFRGNALELRLTAPTVESLDGIKQAISRNGISAELQSATPRGGVVEGRLQVRLGQA
jgi:general secretion pathway protein L